MQDIPARYGSKLAYIDNVLGLNVLQQFLNEMETLGLPDYRVNEIHASISDNECIVLSARRHNIEAQWDRNMIQIQ